MTTDYELPMDTPVEAVVVATASEMQESEKHDSCDEQAGLSVGDSLAGGVAFMLMLTVVQKGVGFLRSVLLCRFLDDDELGRWSLAFTFLLLIAPMLVLGLPGAFGRYVEHYRARGRLRSFLTKTALVCLALSVLGILLMILWRRPLARWMFNDASQSSLMLLLAGVLASVLVFNFLSELLTALRMVRAVSWMQFVQSLLFAGGALALAAASPWGAPGVAVAYGLGCAAAALLAIFALRKAWRELMGDPATTFEKRLLPGRELWPKLLPFAAWVWLVNVLANLFFAADRFMIVHLASPDAHAAQALVGQYHSSLVAPLMLVALGGMLSGVLLPYLTHDWEAGRKTEVSARLNAAVKMTSVSFLLIGVGLQVSAPWLFHSVFGGKYDDGLEVLPWSLAFCVWFSLTALAKNYLWCAERAWLSSAAFAIGLAANLVLNLLLMPRFGLHGAVWATTAANALALGLIVWFNRRLGAHIDRGVLIACCLPLLLPVCNLVGGALAALAGAIAVVVIAWRTRWIFNDQEHYAITQLARQAYGRWLGSPQHRSFNAEPAGDGDGRRVTCHRLPARR